MLKKILEKNFSSLTVLFLIVLVIILLIFPIQRVSQSNITLNDIREINEERYRYIDSVNEIERQKIINSIDGLKNQVKINDSILLDFYNKKRKENEEKINAINNYTDSQLLQLWAERYGWH